MSPVARSALSLLVATSLALAPMRAAFAGGDDGGAVTVWTKDGAMYRGELVERVPNDHITLELATGDTKRIEWKDVERDSADPKRETSVEPPAEPPRDARIARERTVGPRVHIEADHADAVLEREIGSASDESGGSTRRLFEVVCRVPCDKRVAAGAGYRISGPGLRASDTFSIDEGTERRIRASNGSATAFKVGGWLAVYGTAPTLLGTLIVAFTANASQDEVLTKTRSAGEVILGVGVGMIVVGIIFMAANRDSVEVDGKSVAARKPSSGFALTPTGFVF